MKIFYAVQATGNGHISRAQEILPYLQEYGEVDVFLSGNNFSLKSSLPIAYRSKGVSLFYNHDNGAVNFGKTFSSFRLSKVLREARYLPVEKYDLVINDFESITSISCMLKGIHSVHFGHQASFVSPKVPRPEKVNLLSEWVLKNYARAKRSVGLHFLPYDEFIFPPIIRNEITKAYPQDQGHVTVYVGHYAEYKLIPYLLKIRKTPFHVFSPTCIAPYTEGHIKVYPVNKELFTHSLIRCHGIITGAGFETPAEAMYLQKKLLVVPMKGQYEQQCNAAALKLMDVLSLADIDDAFPEIVQNWINQGRRSQLPFFCETQNIVQAVVSHKQIQAPVFDLKEKAYDLYKKPIWSNHSSY